MSILIKWYIELLVLFKPSCWILHKLHFLLLSEFLKFNKKSYIHKIKDSYIYKYLNQLQWETEYHTPNFQKHLKTEILCVGFFEWQSRKLFILSEYWLNQLWAKTLKIWLVFRSHLKTFPFRVPTTLTISKTRLVW